VEQLVPGLFDEPAELRRRTHRERHERREPLLVGPFDLG